jgi:MYXO-CTERM domain-containing protein
VPAFNSAAGKAAGDTSEPPPPPVTVTKQESVGPYETVQLSSTDPMALEAWLAANGYEVPAAVQPIIAQYITEGFDFLAMKLQPGQGVQAMRPVRVTTTGAGLSLPLRMASIGTGATVGITIWVVSDGRYEPKNFPFFHIDDTQLVWDFNVGASNYTTLRQQEEQSFQGKGWEIESALSIAQGLVTQGIATSGSSINVVSGEATTPVDASLDYLPEQDASGNVTKSADEVRTEDVAALFAGLTGPNATFTRIRSDLAHTAMTQDFVVQASPDQSELSNARSVTKYTNLSCPTYDSNCNVTGSTVLSKQVALGLGGQLAAAPAGGASAAGSASCSSARSSEPPFSIPAFATLLALAALRPRRRRQA